MKLYTKEMFLIAAEKCEVSMIDAEHIMKYIDEYVTPIELPSDEEINAEAISQTDKFNPIWSAKGCFSKGYIEGAKWAIQMKQKK